jgi:hypothetical protein
VYATRKRRTHALSVFFFFTECCIFQRKEPKVVNSRGNATKVRDWWKLLNAATKALVELARFRPMVENLVDLGP